jgi:hypothetical protein
MSGSSTCATERRRSERRPAALPVAICDDQWRILVRGRTSNVSEAGVSVVADARRGVPAEGNIFLEITQPPDPYAKPGKDLRRIHRYTGRVARTQQLGNLLGLGIEFTRQLS